MDARSGDFWLGLELAFTLLVGPLALGCLRNWIVEWRHDRKGRIFFTAVTFLAMLLVTCMVVDMVTGHALYQRFIAIGNS